MNGETVSGIIIGDDGVDLFEADHQKRNSCKDDTSADGIHGSVAGIMIDCVRRNQVSQCCTATGTYQDLANGGQRITAFIQGL